MKNSLAYDIALQFAIYSVLIPISIGFYKYKKLDRMMRIFLIYLTTCLLAELIGMTLMAFKCENVIVGLSFSLIQTSTFLIFYLFCFKSPRKLRLFIYGSILLALFAYFFSMYYYLTRTRMNAYPYWPAFANILPGIGLSLYMYYRFLVDLKSPNLLSEPVFWINSSIFFYFSTSLIAFVFQGFLRNGTSAAVEPILWVYIVSGVSAYALQTVAFIKWKKPIEINK